MDYKNKTAVVTGASSGLGVEYAKELAARGANLVLVARRKEALDELAAKITKTSGVKVQTIALDLSTPTSAKKLMAELKKLKIEPQILINNAGFGTSGRFTKDNAAKVQDEIQLNVGTLVSLTHAVLPAMIAAKSGAIVNIASTAAYQPVPGMAVYAATKAFVLSFTSAVWGETKDTGVRVLAVSPGATATEFFMVAGATPSGALAPISDVIKTTFDALDAKKSVPSVVVGGRNAFMATVSKMLPAKLVIGVAASMFLEK
ncbi:MAG: NADP-dependent 3-hydroxy acid dehydrogenase YdfG [Actinomycetota bacterium]|jgi:short-subunit dehydrogenase